MKYGLKRHLPDPRRLLKRLYHPVVSILLGVFGVVFGIVAVRMSTAEHEAATTQATKEHQQIVKVVRADSIAVRIEPPPVVDPAGITPSALDSRAAEIKMEVVLRDGLFALATDRLNGHWSKNRMATIHLNDFVVLGTSDHRLERVASEVVVRLVTEIAGDLARLPRQPTLFSDDQLRISANDTLFRRQISYLKTALEQVDVTLAYSDLLARIDALLAL